MNMFNSTPEPAPPATPVQPGNLPVTPPDTKPPEGTPPVETKKEEETSPLDQFKDMWEPNLDAEGKPVATTPETPITLDPAKLQEIISKADFSKSISQEDLAAINAGGEGATTALAKALNSVAQQTLTQSTLATDKMIKQAVDTATKATETRLAEQIRKQNLSDNLLDSNPVFSNPAVKPVIEAVQAQLATKFPAATTAELTKMAQDYVTAMSESFNPGTTTTPDTSKTSENDWGKFLGVE